RDNHREHIAIVNFTAIENIKNDDINIDILKENGVLKKSEIKFKLLGAGEINRKISIVCNKISKNAKEKIEKSGGTVRII
ncbi:MAG: uL15 family ribosomal protein, partial [Deltaproteobacteria bacterium]|nr:uL15 family ribosomal protein [Deltaproteobacteria bacterium]